MLDPPEERGDELPVIPTERAQRASGGICGLAVGQALPANSVDPSTRLLCSLGRDDNLSPRLNPPCLVVNAVAVPTVALAADRCR
jgi:hypothetical protein